MKKLFIIITILLMVIISLASCSSTAPVTETSTPAPASPVPASPTPASPSPTATPGLTEDQIKFGLTEENRNDIIDVDNGMRIAWYQIDGLPKAFIIESIPDTGDVTDLLTKEHFDKLYNGCMSLEISDQEPLESSLQYFKKRFHSNVSVEFLQQEHIKAFAETQGGYYLSEEEIQEMSGNKTLEEIVNWMIELIPENFWPVKTDVDLNIIAREEASEENLTQSPTQTPTQPDP